MTILWTAILVLALISGVNTASAQEINRGKIVDTKFIVVSSSLVASTIFDVETTFAGVKNTAIPVREESNPIMRPFINAGRPATYAFLGGANTGVIYLSYRMKKSHDPTIRKLWWVISVTATAGHAFAGGFNLRFTFR